jgi:hypothetical protein
VEPENCVEGDELPDVDHAILPMKLPMKKAMAWWNRYLGRSASYKVSPGQRP